MQVVIEIYNITVKTAKSKSSVEMSRNWYIFSFACVSTHSRHGRSRWALLPLLYAVLNEWNNLVYLSHSIHFSERINLPQSLESFNKAWNLSHVKFIQVVVKFIQLIMNEQSGKDEWWKKAMRVFFTTSRKTAYITLHFWFGWWQKIPIKSAGQPQWAKYYIQWTIRK